MSRRSGLLVSSLMRSRRVLRTSELTATVTDGVTVVPLATGAAGDLPSTPNSLLLDRAYLVPAAGMPMRQVTAPELLYTQGRSPHHRRRTRHRGGIRGRHAAFHAAQSVLRDPQRRHHTDHIGATTPSRSGRRGCCSRGLYPDPGTRDLGRGDAHHLPCRRCQDVTRCAGSAVHRARWKAGAKIDEHAFAGPVEMARDSGAPTVVSVSEYLEVLAHETSGALFPSGSLNQK